MADVVKDIKAAPDRTAISANSTAGSAADSLGEMPAAAAGPAVRQTSFFLRVDS